MKKFACLGALLALLSASLRLPAATVSGGSVTTAGRVHIHYLMAGSRDAARTLLLIPGWRCSASIWSTQIDHFAALGDRIVAMDPRSQGESSVVTGGNTPENRATDIHQLIVKLHLQHVVIVGWSQAAQDVAAYVASYGTAGVDGFVLVDSPVSAGASDVTTNPGFVKAILKHIAAYSQNPRAYTDGFLHAIISRPMPAAEFAHLEAEAMKTPVDIGVAMLIHDMFTVDRRPVLRRFDKPTLVIASAQSPLLDAQHAELKLLPQGKFVEVRNAAHAVFVDQPQVFNRMVAAFIASLDAGHDPAHQAHAESLH